VVPLKGLMRDAGLKSTPAGSGADELSSISCFSETTVVFDMQSATSPRPHEPTRESMRTEHLKIRRPICQGRIFFAQPGPSLSVSGFLE